LHHASIDPTRHYVGDLPRGAGILNRLLHWSGSDLAFTERLSNAVRAGNPVAVDQTNVQPVQMASGHDGLDRGTERYDEPKVIQPNRQSEHEQDERRINGISTEPVGTGSYDRSGAPAAPARSTSRANFAEGKQKEQDDT
jgi:hypothetical protein